MNLYINDRLVCNSTQFYAKYHRHAMPQSIAMANMPPPGSNYNTQEYPLNIQQEAGGNIQPEPVNKRENMPGTFGGDHFVAPGVCPDFGEIRVGDIMRTESFYDFNIHNMMTHEGVPEKIMGNMRVYTGPL